MTSVGHQLAHVRSLLENLESDLVLRPTRFAKTREAVSSLKRTIDSEVDFQKVLPAKAGKKKKGTGQRKTRSVKQIQAALRYERSKRLALEKQSLETKRAEPGLRIQSVWWVRAMLADPLMPAQKLEQTCRESLA